MKIFIEKYIRIVSRWKAVPTEKSSLQDKNICSWPGVPLFK